MKSTCLFLFSGDAKHRKKSPGCVAYRCIGEGESSRCFIRGLQETLDGCTFLRGQLQPLRGICTPSCSLLSTPTVGVVPPVAPGLPSVISCELCGYFVIILLRVLFGQKTIATDALVISFKLHRKRFPLPVGCQ